MCEDATMLRLPGPHRGKRARLLTLTNTSSPDCHPKEMAEKKLTESKHCHGPVTLRFSGEPPASGMNPCLCWFVQPHGPCWTTGVRRHLQHLWQTCVRQRNPFKRCLQSTSNSFDTVPGTGEPHVGRGRQVLSKFNRPPVRK